MINKYKILISLFLILVMSIAIGAMKETNRSRIYKPLDPYTHKGGIKGRIRAPGGPIEFILAVATDDLKFVYEGEIFGNDEQSFEFEGLPVRKYDLIVIYPAAWYEGCTLTRGDNTLTKLDLEKINKTIQKSEPFFPIKEFYRAEGQTGRGNKCRAVAMYLRDKSIITEDAKTHKRSFRIMDMMDVGPGWQIAKMRDVYSRRTQDVELDYPKHHYRPQLSRIRVADYMKDVGEINLSKKK